MGAIAGAAATIPEGRRRVQTGYGGRRLAGGKELYRPGEIFLPGPGISPGQDNGH